MYLAEISSKKYAKYGARRVLQRQRVSREAPPARWRVALVPGAASVCLSCLVLFLFCRDVAEAEVKSTRCRCLFPNQATRSRSSSTFKTTSSHSRSLLSSQHHHFSTLKSLYILRVNGVCSSIDGELQQSAWAGQRRTNTHLAHDWLQLFVASLALTHASPRLHAARLRFVLTRRIRIGAQGQAGRDRSQTTRRDADAADTAEGSGLGKKKDKTPKKKAREYEMWALLASTLLCCQSRILFFGSREATGGGEMDGE